MDNLCCIQLPCPKKPFHQTLERFYAYAKALSCPLKNNRFGSTIAIALAIMKVDFLSPCTKDIGGVLTTLDKFILELTHYCLQRHHGKYLPRLTSRQEAALSDHDIFDLKKTKELKVCLAALSNDIRNHKSNLCELITAQKKYNTASKSNYKKMNIDVSNLKRAIKKELYARDRMGVSHKLSIAACHKMVHDKLQDSKSYLQDIVKEIVSPADQPIFWSILDTINVDQVTERLLYGTSRRYKFPLPEKGDEAFEMNEELIKSWTEKPLFFYSLSSKKGVKTLDLEVKLAKCQPEKYYNCEQNMKNIPGCLDLKPGMVLNVISESQTLSFGYRISDGVCKVKKWGFFHQ